MISSAVRVFFAKNIKKKHSPISVHWLWICIFGIMQLLSNQHRWVWIDSLDPLWEDWQNKPFKVLIFELQLERFSVIQAENFL